MESFAGKVAVVTGGGNGIGRELVVQLAAEGCSVATCDVNSAAVEETVVGAGTGAPAGVRITAHICDVSDAAAVDAFREEVVAQHETDHLDVLFNNAGIAFGPSFVTDDPALWERIFNVCWGGVYNCSRTFLPLLQASPEALLVNTSSVSGFWANLPGGAYCAAKYAVKGFTEALIADFRTNAPNVKVALVMPGAIGTQIYRNTARILGTTQQQAGQTAGINFREYLTAMGVPFADEDDAELARMAGMVRELFVTPPSEAATIILDGIRAGRWRILVGNDAHYLDEAVRADPEGVYEPPVLSVNDHHLLAGILMLARRFRRSPGTAAGAEYELRVGRSVFTCRVADERLDVVRGAATRPEATLETDARTLSALVTGAESVDDAKRRGAVSLTGDTHGVEQLFGSLVD